LAFHCGSELRGPKSARSPIRCANRARFGPVDAFQVFAFEHFNERHHEWVCSGAPVHDPISDQPIGLIDLSSLWKIAHPWSLELVAVALEAARHPRGWRRGRSRRRVGCRGGGRRPHVRLVRYEPDGSVVVAGFGEGDRGPFPIGSRLTDRVEALGGSVRVSSRPGEGTKIAVELPVELNLSPTAG
jgi:hypothetical protein